MPSLLIFLIALTFSQSFAAAAESVHSVTNATTVGWFSDGDNQRSTIGLLYSCLSTIFLCTWSAMHLNVPAERDTPLRVFWRKCGWMITGLLAPECVAIVAMSERYAARELAQNRLSLPTVTHGFVALMGGYAIHVKEDDGGDDAPSPCMRLDPWDFVKLAKRHSHRLPTLSEVMDRSKCDWISKTLTLIQIFWFVSQLAGRAVQQLPVATLELFTCAIVLCSAVTYFAWWDKPLDVQCPMVISWEVPAAFLDERNVSPLEEYHSVLDYPSDYEMSPSQTVLYAFVILLAFTAPHLLGWDFHFPTPTEQLLWRVSGILCAGMAGLMVIVVLVYEKRDEDQQNWLLDGLSILCLGAYILVRAYLLIEVFIGLRSVPVGVYTAVNWAAYIPHI